MRVASPTPPPVKAASRQLFRTSLGNTAFRATYVVIVVASIWLLVMAILRQRSRLFTVMAVVIAALLPLVALVFSGQLGHRTILTACSPRARLRRC